MQITALSYFVKSVADLPMSFYELISEDEDTFVEQLKRIKDLNGYDINEYLIEVADNCVLDFNKNLVIHPIFGWKNHISKIVCDARYGHIVTKKPIDVDFWLS